MVHMTAQGGVSWGQQGLGVSSVARRGSWESLAQGQRLLRSHPRPKQDSWGPELLARKPLHVEGCGCQRVWPFRIAHEDPQS